MIEDIKLKIIDRRLQVMTAGSFASDRGQPFDTLPLRISYSGRETGKNEPPFGVVFLLSSN